MSLPLKIDIVCTLSKTPVVYTINVPTGATVRSALLNSSVLEDFPDFSLQQACTAAVCIGIFSRKVSLDHLLEAGDRIEIYRPLVADPKAARFAKVAKKKS